MGKKSGWLSSVKKVFKPSYRDSDRRRKNVVEVEEEAYEIPESVPVEQFPAETSPDATNDEDESYTIAVAAATAAAAEAAVAAAEAAAKVVRLARYGRQSREEKAAMLIQSYYRGYLARRALHALKGLVRLQALVQGHKVRKQAQMTMRCMQALVRVQARVRVRRLQLAREKVLLSRSSTKTLHADHYDKDDADPCFMHTRRRGSDHCQDSGTVEEVEEERSQSNGCAYSKDFGLGEWDGRQQSMEAIKADSQRKHDAIIRRERALAYAFALQSDHEKSQWGWTWLERWMANQQWQAGHAEPPAEDSYVTATDTDDLSEKTVEMDPGRSPPNSKTMHRDEFSGPPTVPSYMAATQSARAKVRGHVPRTMQNHSPASGQSNLSRRRGAAGFAGASSSSGGTSGAHQPGRSPAQTVAGLPMQARRGTGYRPDSSCTGDERLPPFGERGLGGVYA